MTSYVKYLLPQTISSGEFSMDVVGLRANAPGDKSKVFGMQEGQGDFITNDYRVDIQYRGANGAPPNAIQWRVIYGDADDLDVRYEPDTAKRFASVLLLNPDTPYHWKFTWGPKHQAGRSGRRLWRTDALRLRHERARRRLHTEPTLRLSRRAGWPQRQRGRDDSGNYLPQRLALEPAEAGHSGECCSVRQTTYRFRRASVAASS